MKQQTLLVFMFAALSNFCWAQQTFYDVTAGNGNGIRFWNGADEFKIHMGNSSDYHYGPVYDYSIKTNMTSEGGRGWTWGQHGATPIAALSNIGTFQLAGQFRLTNANEIELGVGVTKEGSAGKFAYQKWSSGLDIVGAGTTSSNRKITFWAEGGTSFNGNVGIGTTTTDAALSVNGQVHATEVKVTLSVPGPDYVFESGYHLRSLEEIKTYIEQNKHLPEVPSAKEMEANGINLSEMNMMLLKKVEELTLYVIELKKENDRNKDLNARIEKLENKK